MSKRLITENWYNFLKEYEEPMNNFYVDDPGEGLATKKALEQLEVLRAQKEMIEKQIRELEMQIDSGKHSVSQIKEGEDGR